MELEHPDNEPQRAQLQTRIDVRSTSLAVLAVLASVFTLHWASAVFIPLLLALMFSYALSPIVARLHHWHLPRALAAAVVLLAATIAIGSTAYSLGDDAAAMVESLPDAAQKLRESVRIKRGAPEGAMQKMQRAATNLEQAAEENASSPPRAGQGVTRVQIERRRFNVNDYLWSGTLGLVGFIGQATVVFFITFFLLASGDGFRRKMARLAGPTFSRKKITIQVLDEITAQIQRYLLVQMSTSVLVGVTTWATMLWIGVERAAVWGLLAAVLNLVPYIGPIVTASWLALVGFLQFGTLGIATLIGGVSLLINTLEGNLLTPWLTGRTARMDPVVIFVGVLAWGWLWGMWGLLLGAPLLMAVKSVCDHIEDLKPIGELLGD